MEGLTLDELIKKGAKPVQPTGGLTLQELQAKGAKPAMAPQAPLTPDQKSAQDYGALFPARTGEGRLAAGAKAAGNLPSSTLNFGKNIYTAVRNPINTLEGIATVGAGAAEKLIPGKQKSEQTFDALTGALKERYGSLENLQRTATNDPVGFATDALSVFTGGAGALGKLGTAEKLIAKTGQAVTNPTIKTASVVADKVGDVTKFGINQTTGLSPETISELVRNPKAFKGVTPEIRMETANAVKDALDTRLSELSELGTGYEKIREGTAVVRVPEGSVQNILDKYRIEYKEGEIVTTAESLPLSAADKVALKDFLSTFGNEPIMTGNGILNARSTLSNMSKYDAAKTGNLQKISRDFRGLYDNVAKGGIPDLAKLDFEYAPEVTLLKQLKKDIFTPAGELKDGAVSKIANLNGKGKEKVLERVKQIVPDIEQRVRLIKAVEDIEKTKGSKVGTYSRTATQILGVSGVATGNIPAIVVAILSQPEIAVPLLKGAGLIGNKSAPVLNALKKIANDVNSFQLPPSLLAPIGNDSVK